MKPIIAIVSFMFLAQAFGDGLRVKDGRLVNPHSIFVLTPSQREEIKTLNTVTLTKEQWAELRSVSPGSPKRLDGLLSIDWNDSLDHVKCEGVILRDGRLAVLHKNVSIGFLRQILLHGQATNTVHRRQAMIMADDKGNFFVRGISLKFEDLIEAIQTSNAVPREGPRSQWPRASIQLPPTLNTPLDKQLDPVLQRRLETVYRALAKKGWNGGDVPEWLSSGSSSSGSSLQSNKAEQDGAR